MLSILLFKIGLLLLMGGFISLFFVNNPGRLFARIISIGATSLITFVVGYIIYRWIIHVIYAPWGHLGIDSLMVAFILGVVWVVDWAFKNDGWN